MAVRERKSEKTLKRGDKLRIRSSGRNNIAKSCLLSTTLALLSGMGARVIADWGVEEDPGATFRHEKAFVSIWPSSVSSFSLYLVLALHFRVRLSSLTCRG